LIFVTGATGFIGQRLLHALESNPASLAHTQPSDIKILSRRPHQDYKTVICDLEIDLIPEDTLNGIETVFHLAGFAHDIRDATEVEHLYRAVNVDATEQLAEIAVASGVKRFVFVSSVKAGGNSVQCGPEGVYGKSKHEAELKVLEIGRQSVMHISIVRSSLVYGPGVKGNLALMQRGIEQGWFPPIPETENRRSMIHVDDLVQALLLVAEDKRANREIFVATDGVPHSSREIYDAICQSVGKTVPQWSVPKIIFEGLSLLSPRIRYKVNKLLGDDYYSSDKFEKLGFRAKKSLKDFDR
jgi:UDP-glucose 4-epimerase